ALHYAHRNGVVHRDVKPANIMVDRNGTAHVMDFGLAKRVDEQDLALTKTGTTMGTPAYMSPEQAQGNLAAIDAQSDVYSIGAVLYEMLTGRPPFEGSTTMAVLLRVIDEDPKSPRKLNPRIHKDIETICMKAMEKDKARRYQSAWHLAEDIRRFNAGEVILAAPIGPLRRFARKALKRIELTIAAAAAVLILAGTLAYAVYRGHADRVEVLLERERRVSREMAAGREAIERAASAMRGLDPTPHRMDEKLFSGINEALDDAEGHVRAAQALDPSSEEAARAIETVRALRRAASVKKLLAYGYGFMESVPPNYAGAVVVFRLALDADPENAEAARQLREALGIRKAVVESDPPGARAWLSPLDVEDSLLGQGDLGREFPQELGKTPLSLSLPPGTYRIVLETPDAGRTRHEFPLEMVRKDDGLLSARLSGPHENMVFMQGGQVVGPAGENLTAGDFYVDRYEYPNRIGEIPKTDVSRIEAAALCERAGKKLCTIAQWLRACSGPHGTRYPYGDAYVPNACASGFDQEMRRTPFRSGSFARCRTPHGVYDMVGNVAEWTEGAEGEPSIRGGSWLDPTNRPLLTASCRADTYQKPEERDFKVGFRCCIPVAPAEKKP
ncbi:MAG: protein kinase, partial [Planctomycetota bacterium]|nr:protein kinase [Planctomycetota bacterium]